MAAFNLPYNPRCPWEAPGLPESMIYEDLDIGQFRVLRLNGYTDQGVLKCSLRGAFHETVSKYSAISYTWNETERVWYGKYNASPKPIWINDKLVQVVDKVANILCIAMQVSLQTCMLNIM